MKKLVIFVFAVGLILSGASLVFAGGIDNKQNFSAEYLRTFSRNAATDAADVTVYNPAGVMEMQDGIYADLAIFYALKDYSNTIGGVEYKSDAPSMVPGLFALYKTNKWAAFAAFTIPAGGGTVEYDQGNATTLSQGNLLIAGINFALTQPPFSLPALTYYDTIKNQRLEADSFYYGYTLGGAYEVNQMVSVSLGARYIDATKEAKASMTISPSALGAAPPFNLTDRTFDVDYEETADGWGGFAGVNITPTEQWNIGIRYETKTKLDFETKVKTDDTGMLTDGAKERQDLPGLLGLGVGYDITPKAKVEVSYTYYLEKGAKWEDERLKDAGNSYDLGIALTYTFNSKLKGSVGYMFTDTGIDPDDMLPEAPELDANTVCGGILYEAIPGLNLNFAVQHTFYDKETTSTGIELDKDVTGFGFGIQYKFK